MMPTLLGITLVCFVIINLAPGSPIQQKLAEMRFGGAMGGAGMSGLGGERGDQGVTAEVIEALKKQYGFDKPLLVRYGIWLKNIITLNFGDSFVYEEPVIDVILARIPISFAIRADLPHPDVCRVCDPGSHQSPARWLRL